jgi:hypothetical protein
MNTIAFPQDLGVKLDVERRTGAMSPGAPLAGTSAAPHVGHRWAHRLQHWLHPAVCEDCGAPRGTDGRFLCEAETDFLPLGAGRRRD